ncbi:MAG TPA: ABC transporter ATP-binding protein [Acidimicrobiia bacterium]|nr:ABC transporter ATP-binding protein [Acidimicrobiia bacterium]
MTTLLDVAGLSKGFGGLQAVNDCSFTVERGAIAGLIGPNGAGKTTAFNMISGVLRPDAGAVLVDGVDITGMMPHKVARRGVGRTFQITRELGDLTVLENMVVPTARGRLSGLFGARMLRDEEERAMELLDFVGISRLADEKARNLSFGQRKLLEFASALMADPTLLLLDEPAGGVNPALLERMMERIRTLNEQGLTFLIVEHNMDVVMNLCRSIVVMAHGEVVLTGSPAVVQNDDRVLDAYLGKV